MTDPDALVQDYLARLERAAAQLDPDRRAELLAGITEHIEAARDTGAAQDEAGVRTVLDRLGAPADIVAAADDRGPSGARLGPAEGPPGLRRGTGLELASVLLLTAGSFFPALGWLAGAVLLWCSARWRVREKLLGTLVVPLGPGGVLIFGGLLPLRNSQSCTAEPVLQGSPAADSSLAACTNSGPPEWVAPVLLVTLLLAAVVVPIWLYRTARRRADAEQAAVPALL